MKSRFKEVSSRIRSGSHSPEDLHWLVAHTECLYIDIKNIESKLDYLKERLHLFETESKKALEYLRPKSNVAIFELKPNQ